MKKILVVLLILFSFTIVKAEELNITISDVVISDHTDTLDVSLSSFSTNEVTSNVTFNNIGEFVTYDITIINNDENKYFIKEIKDNNVNQNIEITYDFSDDYIESNETSVIKMTLTYKNQLKKQALHNMAADFLHYQKLQAGYYTYQNRHLRQTKALNY